MIQSSSRFYKHPIPTGFWQRHLHRPSINIPPTPLLSVQHISPFYKQPHPYGIPDRSDLPLRSQNIPPLRDSEASSICHRSINIPSLRDSRPVRSPASFSKHPIP